MDAFSLQQCGGRRTVILPLALGKVSYIPNETTISLVTMAARYPRLLIVSEYWLLDAGGMAVYASELVSRLARRGFPIRLFIPETVPPRSPIAIDGVAATVFSAPNIHAWGRLSILPALLRHGGLSGIDAIVDIAASPYGGTDAILARLFGVPFFVAAHGNEVSRLYPGAGMTRTFRAYCRYAYRHARKIAANSRFTAALFAPLGIPDENIEIIPCGVDTDFFRPGAVTTDEHEALMLPPGKRYIACVAQLKAIKGQARLLQAYSQIAFDFPDYLLVLAGDGPQREAYHHQVNALGLDDRVVFTGHLDRRRLRTLYRIADLWVLPTQNTAAENEGFGLAAAEAMACGCPVAVADFGGPTEYVRDGETGFLFDSTDVTAIAETLRGLLQDSDHRNSVRVAAHRLITEQYTWDRTAQLWTELLLREIPMPIQ